MKLYIVRVFDAHHEDNDHTDSYWFSKEKATARVKDLNNHANEIGAMNLYFDILITETWDMPA